MSIRLAADCYQVVRTRGLDHTISMLQTVHRLVTHRFGYTVDNVIPSIDPQILMFYTGDHTGYTVPLLILLC